MAAKSSSQGLDGTSKIRVYIIFKMIIKHAKENIEDKDIMEKTSSKESVISQELEETPQKRSVSLNIYQVRWAMR